MSKKVLVFGGSNSSTSINKRFATYAASQLTNTTNLIVDLRDFELPVFSVDIERTSGVPEKAIEFQKLIEESDAIVASFAANNGNFSSAFKNLWDWMSRIDTPKIWRDKPMFLLSASPTRRKESFVIKLAKDLFPYFGAQIIAEFFLYSFNHTFKDDGIIDEELWQAFDIQLEKFQSHLDKL